MKPIERLLAKLEETAARSRKATMDAIEGLGDEERRVLALRFGVEPQREGESVAEFMERLTPPIEH